MRIGLILVCVLFAALAWVAFWENQKSIKKRRNKDDS